MKRVIISALVSILTPTLATAQLSGNGFYRVQNNASHRYITINDDIIGQVNKSSTTADLSNIVTWRGFDYVKSNPASIIYIESVSGKYNLSAQGTSVYKIAGGRAYVDIKDQGNDTYSFSVSYSGAQVYLYDDTKSNDKGGVRQSSSNQDYRYWKLLPINTSDNYLGLQPTVQVGDSYYGTLYADYAFKRVSDGIKIYYINAEDEGRCRLKEITSEVIPAATPIIFKCSSNDPAQNMVMPVTDEAEKPTDNYLAGTYFASTTNKHKEFVEYDDATMHVLGVGADGQLSFVTAKSTDLVNDGQHIPMNTCWLRVFNNLTGNFTVLDETQYAGISTVNPDEETVSPNKQGIFSLSGVRMDSSRQLKPGIYIQNGKKMVIK